MNVYMEICIEHISDRINSISTEDSRIYLIIKVGIYLFSDSCKVMLCIFSVNLEISDGF